MPPIVVSIVETAGSNPGAWQAGRTHVGIPSGCRLALHTPLFGDGGNPPCPTGQQPQPGSFQDAVLPRDAGLNKVS